MSAHFERAVLLFEQDRFPEAAKEFKLALGVDPNDPLAHAYLALCLAELGQFEAATEGGRQAIGLAPDEAFVHYAFSRVCLERRRFAEALQSIDQALALDPTNAGFYALKGSLHLIKDRSAEALAAAEEGLDQDPEHVGCTNVRATALVNLGRRGEAADALGDALHRDPEDALTHANQGWAYLHEGKPDQAMEHFREALRLDPTMEHARIGIIEAIKARNLIYAWILKYFLFMERIGTKAGWAVIIGAWFGFQAIIRFVGANPKLEFLELPLTIFWITLVLTTWLAHPLSNLLLRLHSFGRLALSREEITASNWVGANVLVALALLGYGLVTSSEMHSALALVGAMHAGFLLIPVSLIFSCQPGWPRWVAILAAAGLALCALAAGIVGLTATTEEELQPYVVLSRVVLWGSVIMSWVGNGLASVTPRR